MVRSISIASGTSWRTDSSAASALSASKTRLPAPSIRQTHEGRRVTEKLLIVLGITTLCMLSPGPDMVLVMRNTLTGDRRLGGLTALGILTGNLIHIAYCAVGIALLLSRSPVAYNVLRIAGAVYLVYLGVQGIRNAGGSGRRSSLQPMRPERMRTRKDSSATCSIPKAVCSISECSRRSSRPTCHSRRRGSSWSQ